MVSIHRSSKPPRQAMHGCATHQITHPSTSLRRGKGALHGGGALALGDLLLDLLSDLLTALYVCSL